MINIIKDLLKIKNWIKLIKDLGKLKSVILTRFFSYPSKRIRKIQNKYLRNFMIKFWINLSKKNKSFNYFFFSEVGENSKKNFTFNKFSKVVFLHFNNFNMLSLFNFLKYNH